MNNPANARRIIETLRKEAGYNILRLHLLDDLAIACFGSDIVDGLDSAERKLVADGLVINAIKEHRARTGIGLKNAKDVVDAYVLRHAPSKP